VLLAAALPHLLEKSGAVSLPYSVQYRVGRRIEPVEFSPGRGEPVSAGVRLIATNSRAKQCIGQIIMQALSTHGWYPF
jgi:hypothetical protein